LNILSKRWYGGKILALLLAFGLSVGSCGHTNVLQCPVGFALQELEANASFVHALVTNERKHGEVES